MTCRGSQNVNNFDNNERQISSIVSFYLLQFITFSFVRVKSGYVLGQNSDNVPNHLSEQ